jgi:hypothetical protein
MLSLWANYLLFDLRFDYESYFGTIIYIASGVLFGYSFLKTYQHRQKSPLLYGYLLILSLVYFKIPMPGIFGWSLLSFEYLYWLMALILAILFDRYLTKSSHPTVLFAWCLIILFLGDAMGITGLLATLVVALLHVSLLKRAKPYILILLVIIACSVLLQYIVFSPFLKPINKTSDALLYCLSNPQQVIEFIINAYAQSIANFNKPYLLSSHTSQLLVKPIGVGSLLLTVTSIVIYFKNKLYLRTIIPLFLIVYTAIAVAGSVLTRLPTFGPEYALSPRYIRLFIVGFMGCIWIIADSQLHTNNPDERKLLRYQPILFFIPLLTIYVASITQLWASSNVYFRHHQKRSNGIYQSINNVDYVMGKENIRCIHHFCDRGIFFLQDNQLSLFRNQSPYWLTYLQNNQQARL